MLILVSAISVSCDDNYKERNGPKYADQNLKSDLQIVHFAIHPLYNPTKLIQVYDPLIKYLNQNFDEIELVLETSKNYEDFENKYRSKRPELLLPNPWQTLEAISSDYEVISMAGDIEDFKGIFIVRKDSPIKSFKDLKGKNICYPSKTALAACIMPQNFLFRNGVDVHKDINNLYVGSQASVIENVCLRNADIGATWTQPWRDFQKDHPEMARELKVIWETETLINNSVMVREDFPDSLKMEIQRLLKQLSQTEEGKRILQNIGIAGFTDSSNSEYSMIEEYLADFELNVREISR